MKILRIELEEGHRIELKPIYLFIFGDSQSTSLVKKKKKQLALKGLERNKLCLVGV